MVDFFIPKGNEEELASTAFMLGIDDFVFLYSFDEFKKLLKKESEFKMGILFEEKPSSSKLNKAVNMTDYDPSN